jgi:TolB-like protein
MLRGSIIFLVACLFLAPSAWAAEAAATSEKEAESQRVVLYDLQADKELAGLAAQLNDVILLHLGKDPQRTVIGESELSVMLQHEKDKQVVTCEGDDVCLAKISEAVDAERIITGHVGRFGDTYMVNLKISDASKAAVLRGETASAENAGDLQKAVVEALDRLMGGAGSESSRRSSFKMEVAPEGTSAAVLDLKPFDVKPGLAKSLTQLLSLELKKFKGLSVISRDEIKTMLRYESEKQVLQCKDDTSCLVEIGGALGVDFLVSGSIGKLGDTYVLSLKLMDINEAKVVQRVAESFKGAEAHLPQALRFATWALLGKPLNGVGKLKVQANVDEGKFSLNGKPARAFPLKAPLPPLPVGKHRVNLISEGFFPLYQEAYVEPRRTTDLNLAMSALPKPWYKKWWTWTIIGGVATTVAIIALSEQDPTTGSVSLKPAP